MLSNAKYIREQSKELINRRQREFIGTETNLFLRDSGYVTIVDVPCVLLDLLGIALAFQLLAGQPKRDVLVAVLAEQELPEEFTADGAPHQFVEGRAPRPDLFQTALRVPVQTVQAVESVPRLA